MAMNLSGPKTRTGTESNRISHPISASEAESNRTTLNYQLLKLSLAGGELFFVSAGFS